MPSLPRKKVVVTHSGSDVEIQRDTSTVEVTLRENKGSDAIISVADSEAKYFLDNLDVDDIVKIYFKHADLIGDTWHQVFGGYLTEQNPTTTLPQGETLLLKAYGYDCALDRMRVAQEYGVESLNPTLDTLTELLNNASYGIITKYVNHVLNTAVDSGYTLDTTFVLNDATSLKYASFPYTPANDCLRTILDLITASKNPLAGLHWTIIPDGTTAYLCVDQIGNHTTAATKWPTRAPIDPITQGKEIFHQEWSKQKSEANYICYFGNYMWPTGDLLTESASTLWTGWDPLTSTPKAVTLTDDSTVDYFKVGANSLKWDLAVAGAGSALIYYPSTKNLNFNITKICTKQSIAKLDFYWITQNLLWAKIWAGTGSTIQQHYFTKTITDLFPTYPKWGHANISFGPFSDQDDEELWEVGAGTPNWNDIDYIGFELYRPGAGQSTAWFDGLTLTGILTRGAYDSTDIAARKCRMKLVTDSLARSSNIVATDDSGTVAQLAKAELLRSRTRPLTGKIILNQLSPTTWPGQLTHVHSKKYGSSYRINRDMRITEVKHVFSDKALTTVTLTDDLLNGYPTAPTDLYNALLKATNPDFQDRDRGNLKGRDIDIYQTILAKDYPT